MRSGAFYETYREAWHLLKQPGATETAQKAQNEAKRGGAETAAPLLRFENLL